MCFTSVFHLELKCTKEGNRTQRKILNEPLMSHNPLHVYPCTKNTCEFKFVNRYISENTRSLDFYRNPSAGKLGWKKRMLIFINRENWNWTNLHIVHHQTTHQNTFWFSYLFYICFDFHIHINHTYFLYIILCICTFLHVYMQLRF